ncbi:hypothetical protein CF641_37550 [Burkholderia pseudomallei]|nr:hypothetical protein CF641_37550 [Burkholderia pseudomallei]
MQLRLDPLEPHLSKGRAGLYVVYGDDPRLAQEACDKIRAAARAAARILSHASCASRGSSP